MENSSLLPSASNIEYCDFYKNLLVEEISLCEYPHLLHYGKCSVIGRVSLSKSGLYHLNNIRLSSIQKEFQIPSNSTYVILLDTLTMGEIPVDTVCEVFGEVVLYDSIHSEKNILPKTAMDLAREISHLSLEDNGLDMNALLDNIRIQYLPAIRAHTFNIVDQPNELIECNLEIRCLKIRN